MKCVNVTSSKYIDFKVENNDKDPKFEAGHHVKISKYKKISAKGYTPNGFKEVFVIKNDENYVPWAYVIENVNGEGTVGTFYDNELKETN